MPANPVQAELDFVASSAPGGADEEDVGVTVTPYDPTKIRITSEVQSLVSIVERMRRR